MGGERGPDPQKFPPLGQTISSKETFVFVFLFYFIKALAFYILCIDLHEINKF